jgi:hypothetical protein
MKNESYLSELPQSTVLCDLADSCFEYGGQLSNLLRDKGYDETPRKVIGDLGAWKKTVRQFCDSLDYQSPL